MISPRDPWGNALPLWPPTPRTRRRWASQRQTYWRCGPQRPQSFSARGHSVNGLTIGLARHFMICDYGRGYLA